MAFGGKRLLTVDWDTQDLRMALVQPRGTGIELLKAVSVPVPTDVACDDPERFGAFLREAIRQSRIGNKQAVFCVPREQVVLNTINLPPSPADDLPAIVLNQIARELPFSSDQAVIDFALSMDHDPKDPATALVAAVRIDDIDFYRKVASEAGLSLSRIGLRPYANRLAVMACVSEAADQTVLVVESGPHHTEISVLRGGALVFSRSATATMPVLREERVDHSQDSRITTPGVLDARESEHTREAISRLMVEIIRSFEAYRATDTTASVDHIVVCGATGLEVELAQSLAARFAARAELFAPDRILDLSASRAKELRGFSAVLGLALGHERAPLVSFDFLSPKKPISRRTVRMRKVPRVALTAAFLIAAIGVTYYKFVHLPVAKAEEMRSEVAAMSGDKKRVEEFKQLLDTVEDWSASEQYWPEVLATLTREFPTSDVAQVTRISFDTVKDTKSKGKTYVATMDMRLRTAELGVVNDITEKLRALGFEDVIPDSETPIGGRRTSVYRFDTGVRARLPKRTHVKVAKDAPEEEDDEEEATVGSVRDIETNARTPESETADPEAAIDDAPVKDTNTRAAPLAEAPALDNDVVPANDAVSSAMTTSGKGGDHDGE